MLAESSPGGGVAAILAAWGADGSRYGRHAAGTAADRSHPHIHVHPGRCILCRRCVRACEEIQGQFVYAIEGRAGETRLAWGGGPFATSACVSCGACVTACPADALTDADRERSDGISAHPGGSI